MVDRSIAPTFVAPKKFQLPEVEITHFSNGSRFFSLCAGDQPVIKLEFIFRSGIKFEAKPGISFCTAKMVTEGTANFNSKTISEKLDQFGAFVDLQPGFDYTNLNVHVPTAYFPKIEQVIADILFRPSFPKGELDLLKQIQIQQIRVSEQKNSYLASRLFRSKLYPGSPYGHVIREESLKEISADLLHEFFNEKMNGQFDIFLTGQFDDSLRSRLTKLVEDHLQDPFDQPIPDHIEDQYFQESVSKEESLQSAIYMGKRCINRKHALYPQLLLLNEVFGGYFGSRLMQNIREEKGFTYSIYSHLASMKDDAYFAISTDVKKETKDQTIEEILKEIEKIKSTPIGNKELIQAKNYLKGSILNTLTTPFALTEKLKNIYFYDLGVDFYDVLFDQIDAIQPDDLLRFANDHLFDQPLSSVVVG
jgi:predicted Zn-dependent peptidase